MCNTRKDGRFAAGVFNILLIEGNRCNTVNQQGIRHDGAYCYRQVITNTTKTLFLKTFPWRKTLH